MKFITAVDHSIGFGVSGRALSVAFRVWFAGKLATFATALCSDCPFWAEALKIHLDASRTRGVREVVLTIG